MEKIRFTVSRPQRLLLFLCMVVVGLIVDALLTMVIGADTTPKVRIATVIQDVLVFAVPAIATAVVVTRQPAYLLMLRRPAAAPTLLVLLALIMAIPALNAVVEWNESLPLPESLRQDAESQKEMISMLFGGTGAGSLVAALLIIGLMAPLTEELVFRGCLQRLIGSMTGVHVAIWITAIIFSLVHFDMTGFVPRVILGAIFGYAMIWAGSVWAAVACHALNNCLTVVAMWLEMRGDATGDALQSIGTSSAILVVISAVAFLALMLAASRRHPSPECP